jgi:hypothetical protein
MMHERPLGGARALFMRCIDVPLEGVVDAFYAFFVLNGRLASVHRRFNLDLPGVSHTPARYRSVIVLTTYLPSRHGIHPESERVLFPGEDPRVVSDGTRAFVLCRVFDPEGTRAAEYKLAILPDGVERDIVPPALLRGGKNWQPFLRHGRLFALTGFSPLTVVEITEQGRMHVVHRSDAEFWLPAPHDRYTMFRGGSNAVVNQKQVFGLGHLTRCRDDHRPFWWALGKSMRMTIGFSSAFFGLRAKGFNIVDPTSLFLFDGRVHIGLCCSEREWFYGQRFLNLLIALPCPDVEAFFDPDGAEMLAKLTDPCMAALPRSRTFIPRNLKSKIPWQEAGGGVQSHGEAGCLLYGPYEPIDRESAQHAAVTYLTSLNGRTQRAGRFEVSCCRDGNDDVLAAIDLPNTSGHLETITLPFCTSGRLGWLLETRIIADGPELNVLSIRIVEQGCDPSDDAAP